MTRSMNGRLLNRPSLSDLLGNLLHYERDLVGNPRCLCYFPPPASSVDFELSPGAGDLGRYLFGANVPWSPVKPCAINDRDWEIASNVFNVVRYSTLSPYDFIIRIHHLFIEVALPVLLLAHCASNSYPSQFAQELKSRLREAVSAWGRVSHHCIEDYLDQSGSQHHFKRDPAVLLNRLRIIRNNVVHGDPSVEECGGVKRWGGVYLRYFGSLLEELGLVVVGGAAARVGRPLAGEDAELGG